MCGIDLLQRLGAHGLPSAVTVTTSSALACCLRKRWTPCLDPALSQAILRPPREERSRVLLPPRHVSSGCFQASPLYSPYPVLCLCGCSMAVTSFTVPRLQVAFWGNPSHKAGVRGAVLVLIHSKLEGLPARQVCFLHHGLTPGLCSGTNGSHQGKWIPQFPQQALLGWGTGSLPYPYTHISAVVKHMHPCSPALPTLAAPFGRARWAPAFLPWPGERGGFCFPPWLSLLPRANGSTWPCLGASQAARY